MHIQDAVKLCDSHLINDMTAAPLTVAPSKEVISDDSRMIHHGRECAFIDVKHQWSGELSQTEMTNF